MKSYIKKKLIGALALAATATFMLTGCASKNPAEYTDQAMEALTSQNYSGALTMFDQAMLEGEDREIIYRGMGLCYMGQGDYRKAITAFESALANADIIPGDLEYDINYYMAICYYKLGLYNEAIAVYDSIATLNPKDYEVYILRGTMKLYLSDVDNAMADFDNAVALAKDDYSVYLDVYQCMKERGYADNAVKYLDVVMAAEEKKVDAYDKGRLCYFSGQYQNAENYLEKARSEGNLSLDLIMLLCECYKLEQKYDYAIAVYSTYLDANQNPEIYNQMGLCYVANGDYTNALSAFQMGIAIEDNNTCIQTLNLNEIACYEYMHMYDEAREKLTEYLSIYPMTEDLEREYAFLTTR